MSQPLPYDEIKFDKKVKLEDMINAKTDDSEDGYLSEIALRYPYNIREKTKHFPFAHENRFIKKVDFNEHMKKKLIKKFSTT